MITHQDLIDRAAESGLPVVWFRRNETFTVVIDGHVFNLANAFEAVYVYHASFSVFCVEWDSLKQGGVTKKISFPNRGSLELMHL